REGAPAATRRATSLLPAPRGRRTLCWSVVLPRIALARRGDPEKSTRLISPERSRMHKPIRRVGVIGAGVMGSGIAAHLANAGVHAILLDIVPPDLPSAERGSRAARDRFA